MPFRYLRDPLFLFCLALYWVNRLLLKPVLHTGLIAAFCHNSLNDVICIPFWVPIMLWMMRQTKMRRTDAPPHGAEILVPLFVWSWFFELVLPFWRPFRHLAVCDPNDILCYTVGALFASMFWNRYYSRRRPSPTPAADRT